MNTREPGLGAGDSTERMKRAPSPEPRAPSRLPRQVKLFGWVSLLNDFASEMIYPLLPAFVTGVLGGGAGALGALDGAAEFAAAVVKLGAGRAADPPRRRGAVVGRGCFTAVVVLLRAVWAVEDGRRRQRAVEALPDRTPLPPSTVLYRPFPPALFAVSAFYLLRMPDTLIILRSQELGVPVAIVPLLWAAVHVVRSSSSFVGGAASDGLGPGRTMWAGWLVYATLAWGMARAATAGAALGLFLVLGLVAGLTESPERALVARLAGPRQGSGVGGYHGVTGVAALIRGGTLGAAVQRFGAGTAFFASAAGGPALLLVWPLVSRSASPGGRG